MPTSRGMKLRSSTVASTRPSTWMSSEQSGGITSPMLKCREPSPPEPAITTSTSCHSVDSGDELIFGMPPDRRPWDGFAYFVKETEPIMNGLLARIRNFKTAHGGRFFTSGPHSWMELRFSTLR